MVRYNRSVDSQWNGIFDIHKPLMYLGRFSSNLTLASGHTGMIDVPDSETVTV